MHLPNPAVRCSAVLPQTGVAALPAKCIPPSHTLTAPPPHPPPHCPQVLFLVLSMCAVPYMVVIATSVFTDAQHKDRHDWGIKVSEPAGAHAPCVLHAWYGCAYVHGWVCLCTFGGSQSVYELMYREP